MIEDLMTEDELCKALSLSKPTLQTWRSLRKGPPWIKVGRNIFFDKQKVIVLGSRRRRATRPI